MDIISRIKSNFRIPDQNPRRNAGTIWSQRGPVLKGYPGAPSSTSPPPEPQLPPPPPSPLGLSCPACPSVLLEAPFPHLVRHSTRLLLHLPVGSHHHQRSSVLHGAPSEKHVPSRPFVLQRNLQRRRRWLEGFDSSCSCWVGSGW